MSEISNELNKRVFRRTELAKDHGKVDRLGKFQQSILAAIDEGSTYLDLSKQFEGTQPDGFELAMVSLIKQGLIFADPIDSDAQNSDFLKASIEGFDSDKFFSSSMGSMNTGSGVRADTRKNLIRAAKVSEVKVGILEDDELDLLDNAIDAESDELKKKGKGSSSGSGQASERRSKRKREKSEESTGRDDWLMKISLGLVVFGVSIVITSFFLRH